MKHISFINEKKTIANGFIKINGKPSNENYLMKNGDVLTHKTIRKELPVYKTNLDTIFESDEILVINKPPSLPIHGCGGYLFNTVIKIVELEKGHPNIHGEFISGSSLRQTDFGYRNFGKIKRILRQIFATT